MAYTGWELPESERARLLGIFTPIYPDVIAHHVTLAFGVDPANAELPTATGGRIVGHADDGEGVQALVIEINGSTERPDGKTLHVTWSIDRDKGRKPVHSNDVIAKGWDKLVLNTDVQLVPKLFLK